jgi:hypothetical protein
MICLCERGGAGLVPAVGLIRSLSALLGETHHSLAARFPCTQAGVHRTLRVKPEAGADLAPQPFDPVLRGLLLTGAEPRFLRAGLAGGRGATSTAQPDALWWPPAKIVGRYLAPFLAKRAGITLTAPTGDSMHIDLHLSHDNSLSSSIQ